MQNVSAKTALTDVYGFMASIFKRTLSVCDRE